MVCVADPAEANDNGQSGDRTAKDYYNPMKKQSKKLK